MTETTELQLLKQILNKLDDHDQKFEKIDQSFDQVFKTLAKQGKKIEVVERELKDLIHMTSKISEVAGENQLRLEKHEAINEKVSQAFAQ